MAGHEVTFPSLADIAYNLRLNPEPRFAIFIGWRTFDELPPIESDEQYEAYAAEEDRIRTGSWDGRMETFAQYSRSKPGLYAASLATRMIEWEMRLAGTSDN